MKLHTMPTMQSNKPVLFACANVLLTLALRLRALFVLPIIVVRIIKLKLNSQAKPNVVYA